MKNPIKILRNTHYSTMNMVIVYGLCFCLGKLIKIVNEIKLYETFLTNSEKKTQRQKARNF